MFFPIDPYTFTAKKLISFTANPIFGVSNHIIHSFLKFRIDQISGIVGLVMVLGSLSIPVLSQKNAYNLTLDTFTFSNAWATNTSAEKGSFVVLENRSKSNGKTLKLRFVRLKSTATKPLPPVFFLSGGPGFAATSRIKRLWYTYYQHFQQFADVVLLDQRGTGQSAPNMRTKSRLKLPLDKLLTEKESQEALYDFMKSTRQELINRGIDLGAYNTKESAADLDDLRKALGYDKISIWGQSYGSHLGLAYLKYYGQNVDKAILGGVNGLNQRLRMPLGIDEALARMDDYLQAEPGWKKEIPNLKAMLKEVIDRLNAKPVVITNKKGQQIKIGAYDFQVGFSFILGNTRWVGFLPFYIKQAHLGNFRSIVPIVTRVKRFPLPSMVYFPMTLASGFTPQKWQVVQSQKQQSLLADAVNFPSIDRKIYQIWQVPDLGNEFRRQTRSDKPVLFLSGDLDFRTSLKEVEQVRKSFPNSRHIVIEKASHDFYFFTSLKLRQLMADYLKGKLPDSQRLKGRLQFLSPNNIKINSLFKAKLSTEGITTAVEYLEKDLGQKYYLSASALLGLIQRFYRGKKLKEAQALLGLLQKIYPKNDQGVYFQGMVLQKMGKKKEARRVFEKVLLLNPFHVNAAKALQKLAK